MALEDSPGTARRASLRPRAPAQAHGRPGQAGAAGKRDSASPSCPEMGCLARVGHRPVVALPPEDGAWQAPRRPRPARLVGRQAPAPRSPTLGKVQLAAMTSARASSAPARAGPARAPGEQHPCRSYRTRAVTAGAPSWGQRSWPSRSDLRPRPSAPASPPASPAAGPPGPAAWSTARWRGVRHRVTAARTARPRAAGPAPAHTPRQGAQVQDPEHVRGRSAKPERAWRSSSALAARSSPSSAAKSASRQRGTDG